MRKAGVIRINLTAGSAEFHSDMDKAEAKIRQFKSHGVSDVQATSAAFRAMKGEITNNVSAAENFVATILKAGSIAQAAFPVVGALAFGSVVVELGEKVHKFFDDVEHGQERAADAFREVNAPLRATNAELALANARLEQDIAKLEGKPQNNLKIALEETKLVANQLADALERDLDRVQKLLEEQNISVPFGLISGQASTSDLGEDFKKFRRQMMRVTDEGNLSIASATDEPAQKAAREQMLARQNTLAALYIANLDEQIAAAEKAANPPETPVKLADGTSIFMQTQDPKNEGVRMEKLRDLRLGVRLEQAGIAQRMRNADLTERKDELTQSKDNADADKPLRDRMTALRTQLEALRVSESAIGKSEAFQALAVGYAEAQKAIDDVDKALAKNQRSLSEVDKLKIVDLSNTIAATRAEIDWETKLTNSTRAIDQRIAAQRGLTDAIGKGYEATRKALIEGRVAQELGSKAFDPEWMTQHRDQVDQLRSKVGSDVDTQHEGDVKQAIDGLNRQIEMERALAAVQSQGAEALRRVALAYRIRALADKGATQEQIQAEMDLYVAQRRNESASNIAAIDQRTAAFRRLSDAVLGGAEAERQAALESKYMQMQRAGATDDEVASQRREDAADFEQSVTKEALKTGMVYRDQLTTINQQLDALDRLREIHGSTFEIEVAMRDLENRRLDVMAQATLKLGTARDGVKAFFIEMQKDSQTAAQTVYNALNTAFSRTSENLAKLATGQKTSFGPMLQDIGQEMVQQQIKGAMQKGIGLLGKMTGLDLSAFGGKPDGTSAEKALWVRMSSTVPGLPSIPGIPNFDPGKLFGGGSMGGGIFSLMGKAFGGFRAEGGWIDPGRAYIVGERGPEVFMPSRGGTVFPNGTAPGGTTVIHYHVDARGADLGAESRVRRGLAMTHDAAVMNSVRAQQERGARTPRR